MPTPAVFTLVKSIRVGCLGFGGSRVAALAALRLAGLLLLGTRFERVAPHVVDTLSFSSAL